MKEYEIAFQEVKKVGIPLYRCLTPYFADLKDTASNILINRNPNKVRYQDTKNPEHDRNFFYGVFVGTHGVVVDSVQVDLNTDALILDLHLFNLYSGRDNTSVPVKLALKILNNKDSFDKELYNNLMQVLESRGIEWWDFISLSEAKVALLSYENTAIGYRFRLAHRKIKPLAGNYAFDMDIETANKLGFKPSEYSVEKAHLKDDYFVSLEESVGQHVIDVSSCIDMCRKLIRLVRQ